MLLGIPLSRNVTWVTVAENPFSMTMLSCTALTVPLTVPVLIAPRIKNLLPHPHQAARRAKPSVSDRRRFTTPPPFGKKNSHGDFTPGQPRSLTAVSGASQRSRAGCPISRVLCEKWGCLFLLHLILGPDSGIRNRIRVRNHRYRHFSQAGCPISVYTPTVCALGFAASNCLSTYCKIPPLA
jgi:hypothetical protein